MLSRFLHSIHVPHEKHTANMVPTRMIAPKTVIIPLSMHIGAPSTPLVKVGDYVKLGQKIAEANGFVSVPIHASVSGTVKKIDTILSPNGSHTTAVFIERSEVQETLETIAPPVITDFDLFLTAVKESGAVGLGGAGFPTHVKFKVDPERVEYILINGAECEPYITSDTHTMVDNPSRMMYGILELKKFYPKAHILIGIEKNKPTAIHTLRRYTDNIDRCDVLSLPSTYPQGGEKSLIYNTIHRVVPEGKLPIDVGCIVMNATTLSFIGKYIKTGMPLVSKCITLDGSAVKNPQNLIVPIGTKISDIVDYCGGLKEEPGKILFGGPMMGLAVPDMEQPITKTTNAVLIFNKKEATLPEQTACIHCGRCMKACPMNLSPVEMVEAGIDKDAERLKKLHVNLCIECGSCSFVCPAKRNLTESHKLSKLIVKEAGIK